MKFVRLTHSVLLDLKAQGYNVLRSPSRLDSDIPTWMPFTMQQEEIESMDFNVHVSTPMSEIHFLVIDDALQNIREQDLIGMVWVYS